MVAPLWGETALPNVSTDSDQAQTEFQYWIANVTVTVMRTSAGCPCRNVGV